MTMFQRKAKVFKNIEVARNYYKIQLECPAIAHAALPGQFIEIKVSEENGPLLRRPFGIHSVKGKYVEALFEAVGIGTQALSRRKPGESIDIIGPLGNGFSMVKDARSILVAGGMGVAPLVFLAECLARSQKPAARRKPIVLIGVKTKTQILCEKEFKKLGCEVKIATDNGSRGFKGYVSELLKKELRASRDGLSTTDYKLPAALYACGPVPMVREVSQIARVCGLECQVSLEAHMACGIGACLGCVVKVRSQKSAVSSEFEYQRVCKEGPVFRANQILWGKE